MRNSRSSRDAPCRRRHAVELYFREQSRCHLSAPRVDVPTPPGFRAVSPWLLAGENCGEQRTQPKVNRGKAKQRREKAGAKTATELGDPSSPQIDADRDLAPVEGRLETARGPLSRGPITRQGSLEQSSGHANGGQLDEKIFSPAGEPGAAGRSRDHDVSEDVEGGGHVSRSPDRGYGSSPDR